MRSACLTSLLGFLLAGVAGCVNLSPQENQSQFFVLGSDVSPEAWQTSRVAEGFSIAFRPVRLAAYLDTPALVTRLGPNQVVFSEFYRWGEDLGRAINRTVVGYVGAQLPVERIDIVPLPSNTRYDYIIQLHVIRFEGELPPAGGEDAGESRERAARQGIVRMVANWEIIEPETGTVLHHGTTDHSSRNWTVGDYAGLVNQLDGALGILARDIVAALNTLPDG